MYYYNYVRANLAIFVVCWNMFLIIYAEILEAKFKYLLVLLDFFTFTLVEIILRSANQMKLMYICIFRSCMFL